MSHSRPCLLKMLVLYQLFFRMSIGYFDFFSGGGFRPSVAPLRLVSFGAIRPLVCPLAGTDRNGTLEGGGCHGGAIFSIRFQVESSGMKDIDRNRFNPLDLGKREAPPANSTNNRAERNVRAQKEQGAGQIEINRVRMRLPTFGPPSSPWPLPKGEPVRRPRGRSSGTSSQP